MKFLFWLLGLFALAVALALASHNPGYMLLVYPPYRIEMSLTLFLLLLLALLVFSHLAVQLVSAALRLPAYVRQFRSERAQARGRSAMMEALSAFFEGRYAAAEKAAAQAMELGEASGINPIIAARAAHELREFDKRDAYLAAAEGKTVGEATMRLMATTKFNLDQHQPQQALNSLNALREAGVKNHVGALHLELKAQQQARNWDAVLDVVSQLERRAAMDATAAEQMRQQAWLEKIRAQAQDAQALQAVWKNIPVEFRRHGKIAAVAARAFIILGDCQSARQILTDSLDEQWDSDLAMLYGDCLAGDMVGQIEQAERWLRQNPDDAGLLLALGKLCLHQGLWGKAQNYLDASISVNPTRAAYTALGQLAEKLQKPDAAFGYFQKAMGFAGQEK
ncbi:MAG: heme biosynthesis HemY N-terminal domain-containing protein [Gallionellaceae bacterium]|nr:heme biosynthesis HemY N-terminal domain-containing protein [Gallionellaceae bacterium]